MDQVIDLSMTLYPVRVFPARQSMLTERVYRSASGAIIIIIRPLDAVS